jgi:TBC1 domain family protein 5
MSDTIGVPGRSIAWKVRKVIHERSATLSIAFAKLFLAPNEPLQRPTQSGPTPPLECLRVTRMEYVGLLLEKMRAPDGSYEDGLSIPGQDTFPKGKTGRAGKLGLEKNNPLSLDNEVRNILEESPNQLLRNTLCRTLGHSGFPLLS